MQPGSQTIARYQAAQMQKIWQTEEGKQYFATDDGRAELAQLVNYIRTGTVKPKQ